MGGMASGCCGVLGTSSILGVDRAMAYVRLSTWLCTWLLIFHAAENYMEHPPRQDSRQKPGALGLGQAQATRIYCAFYVFYYATPIGISVIADSYLGRYATLVGSMVIYSLGCIIMTVSSLPGKLEKGWGLPGLISSMLMIGCGAGGFRAVIVPFIADQQPWFAPELVRTSGGLVFIDHQLTLQYIYNLYYW